MIIVGRSSLLEEARQASELTLPYLIRGHEEYTMGMKQVKDTLPKRWGEGLCDACIETDVGALPFKPVSLNCMDESQLGEDSDHKLNPNLICLLQRSSVLFLNQLQHLMTVWLCTKHCCTLSFAATL